MKYIDIADNDSIFENNIKIKNKFKKFKKNF